MSEWKEQQVLGELEEGGGGGSKRLLKEILVHQMWIDTYVSVVRGIGTDRHRAECRYWNQLLGSAFKNASVAPVVKAFKDATGGEALRASVNAGASEQVLESQYSRENHGL